MRVPARFMVSAMQSGSGKTVLTCGLACALRARGLAVRAFKCGPDYIDPMFHERALGVASRNLDLFLQGETGVRRTFERGCSGTRGRPEADVALIEGAMGLYDGVGGTDEASAWAVACAVDAPVVLAVRPRGSSLTLAAQLRGVATFREPGRVAAVVLVDCKPSLAAHLAPLIEREAGLAVLGYLPPMEEAALESRHLGLLTAEEVRGCAERLEAVGTQLERTVDLDRLLALAGYGDAAEKPPASDGTPLAERPAGSEVLPAARGFSTGAGFSAASACAGCSAARPPRIAVARDEAFCFYYADNLDALAQAGAQIVEFSPLHDAALPPAVDGLYLGGGYPELHAAALAANGPMRASVARAVREGLPTVAECGGFLYLQRTLENVDGMPWPMAGALPGDGVRTDRLQRFGYALLEAREPSMLIRPGERVPVHEFHYWDATENGGAFTARKPHGNRSWACGFASPTLYAAFGHLHFGGELPLAERFVEAARSYRDAPTSL